MTASNAVHLFILFHPNYWKIIHADHGHVFDFAQLNEVIGSHGILFLFAGGLAYTGGIIFYAIDKIPYNHVIWHLFVLDGAIFHFFMVFGYII